MKKDYYTDASIAWNECCVGFISHSKQDGYSKANVVHTQDKDIHHGELTAVKLALYDIATNYDPNTQYTIYTDSDAAVDLIKRNSPKYSEVSEIHSSLPMIENNTNIQLVKSHCNPHEQKVYFEKINGYKISSNKAVRITKGNSLIDNYTRTCTNVANLPQYRSTPFTIVI